MPPKTSLRLTLLSLCLASTASCVIGQMRAYKVGGTPTQQIVQVESETEVETFTAKTSKVSGALKFDPAKKTGSGKLIVEAASLDTGIAKRNDQLYGSEWLDVKKNPKIVFEAAKVEHSEGDEYKVTGTFTLRGVAKTLTATVEAKPLAASAATKKAGLKGDVLQLKTTFKIMLADFGIKSPQTYITDFPNEVTITVTVYAQTGL